MIDDELIREATAALDDLGELAPKPPTLAAITAGSAPLRRIEPRTSRWRFAAALTGAAAVTVLVVGIAALVGSSLGGDTTQSVPVGATDASGQSINGTWILTSYTYEGETHTVEAATVVAPKQIFAWIEISDETVTGNTGCNSLDGSDAPQLDGDVLVFGEILTSAVGCLEETSEPAFLDALRSGPDGVRLLIDNDTMTWTTDTVELTFERRDRRPVPPPPTWGTTFGRLDCSPGVYLTQNLPGADISLTEALRSIGGVGRVQEGDPFWWGLDEGDVVIAGAAYGDIEPRVVELSACASLFGLRSDADLGAASYTWVNGLGLSQTSPIVWSSRFIEMCSPASPDLSTLAQRYLEEDTATSVRADGSNPTLEEAVDRLDDEGNLFADCQADLQLSDASYYAPVKFDAEDSGGLMLVNDGSSADRALEIIIDQGEGLSDRKWADPSHQELTHYYKFEQIADGTSPIGPVWPVRTNPKTADFPDPVANLSDFFNALYGLMFVTMGDLFSGEQDQDDVIGRLYSLMTGCMTPTARTLVRQPIADDENAAPTFEVYEFDSDPWRETLALAESIVEDFPDLEGVRATVQAMLG